MKSVCGCGVRGTVKKVGDGGSVVVVLVRVCEKGVGGRWGQCVIVGVVGSGTWLCSCPYRTMLGRYHYHLHECPVQRH